MFEIARVVVEWRHDSPGRLPVESASTELSAGRSVSAGIVGARLGLNRMTKLNPIVAHARLTNNEQERGAQRPTARAGTQA